MLRYCFALLLFVFFITSHTRAQTKTIERLKKQIEKAPNQDKKLQALFALCEERLSLNTDTLCKYANIAKELSFGQNNLSNIALSEYYIANCLIKKGALKAALKICDSTILKLPNKNSSANALMKLMALKSQILIRTTKYKEGIAEAYKVLYIAEETQDTLMQMIAKNAIGWANMEMDQTSEALEWFFKALHTSDNIKYHEKTSNIYSNIAAIYKYLHQNDSAEYYIQKAIDFSSKTDNLFFLANSLNILADIYIDTKKPFLAEDPLNKGLAIRRQIGDPFYIVSDISQLALYYASISQPAKGIALSKQGIKMAKQFHLSSKLPYLYHALGQNFKVAGNYKEYSKTLEKIMIFKDSVNLANTAEARAEMDARYDLEKKEKLITLQKLDISEKNYLLYGSLLLLFFTLLMSWFLFRGYKKNQQIKLLKMQAKEKQLAARAVISAEENERKRISRDLHDNIGAYATVLIANTEQLKKQTSEQDIRKSAANIFENAHNIMGFLQESIWVLNNDSITVTGFADRFKLYAKKILQNFPGVQIKFQEQLDNDTALSPSEALNIFRIMQEALLNALKHGKAQHINVSVYSNNTIHIAVKDDGKGFDTKNIRQGNGLHNMQHRAKEAGYKLDIFSNEEGTEVYLKK